MWQPMFLAPTDGQWIVVIHRDFSGAALLRWDDRADQPGWYSPEGEYEDNCRVPMGAGWAPTLIPTEAMLEQKWNQHRE